MALYPPYSTVAYANPVSKRIRYRTTRTDFGDTAPEQRKRQWLYPRRDITLKYNNLELSELDTLWAFYTARSGPYQSFSWIDMTSGTYTGEYVATGDGATTVFSLPSKTATATKVYLDGIKQTVTTNYTIAQGTGGDTEDQVTFVVAPNDGVRITYDFTGLLKVRCVFAEDNLDYDTFYNRLVNTGLQLRGLLNA